MSRYRTKPVEVEAFEWTGRFNAEPPAPWWLADALLTGLVGVLGWDGDKRATLRMTEGENPPAAPFNWIVREPDGRLASYTDVEFRERFEAVPEKLDLPRRRHPADASDADPYKTTAHWQDG